VLEYAVLELRVCTSCRQLHAGYTTCPSCSRPLTLAEEALFLGETFGKYRLDRVLGAGGMGIVYRAIHTSLNKAVALKIVLPQGDDDSFQKRFLREAQVLAELKHPNIVEIYDFDLSAWGAPYYVMEYLEGATLRSLAKSHGGPLPLALLGSILRDVSAGLAFAHRKGVVHRDLKPDNLFVVEFDSRVTTKILDFGIAKVLTTDKTVTHLTGTGEVVGTPQYLSPEQLLGRDIGTHTDQYALALIVAELLQGRAVRAGKTLVEILGEAISRPLSLEQLPEGVPETLRAALQRATQPEPRERFESVLAFTQALDLPPGEDDRLATMVQGLASQSSTPTPPPASAHASAQTPKAAPASPTGTLALGEAMATLATGGAPATTSRFPRRGGLWAARAFGALVLALGALGLWRALRPKVGPPGPSGGPPPEEELVRRARVSVPPDVTAILSRKEDTLILEGGGAVYLLLQDGSQAATRIALQANETVLGRGPEGDVWLRDGVRIVRLDPLKQKRTTWVENLKAAVPLLKISASGRYVASAGPTQLEVCEVEKGECHRRFSAPRTPGSDLKIELSDKYVVASEGSVEVRVFRPDGRVVFSAPEKEAKIRALAVFDDRDLLAVSGWFDHVDVHELKGGGSSKSVPCPEGASDLGWIGDRPTLLLGGPRGVFLWHPGSETPTPLKDAGRDAASLLVTGGGILSLDVGQHAVDVLDYRSLLAPPTRIPLGKAPLWALSGTSDGDRVFAGGADGPLYVVPLHGGKPETVSLHTDGITDLVVRGENMASTSDDKTLAVWQLPRLSVLWRSKAHAFLVNQMWLTGEPPSLWTSSSDGTVKRWSFPQVEEQESLDVSRLLGKRVELQALWAAPGGDLVVAGTWSHALAVLSRPRGGAWKAAALPVVSQTLYRVAEVPGLNALLLTGINPPHVYLYDLGEGRIHLMKSFSHDVFSAVSGSAPGEAFVLGDGALIRYRFERRPDQRIVYGLQARVRTDLGSILSAFEIPGRGLIAAGNEKGELLLVSPGAGEGTEVGETLE
jgi:serine/threonine protein kinase/WD40 repeat protein